MPHSTSSTSTGPRGASSEAQPPVPLYTDDELETIVQLRVVQLQAERDEMKLRAERLQAERDEMKVRYDAIRRSISGGASSSSSPSSSS